MEDIEFYNHVAALGEMVLQNAAKSFGLDFGIINDVLIENSRRLAKLYQEFKEAIGGNITDEEAKPLFQSFRNFHCEDGLGDRFALWSQEYLPEKYR